MTMHPWRDWGLATKLLVSALLLSLLPIGVMSALTFEHLAAIQEMAVQETRAVLLSAQINRLRERLGQEAERLSAVFARLQDEAHSLRSYAEALVASPESFSYRNGSRYLQEPGGSYGNPVADGNSVLFVPRYHADMGALAGATESLDLVLKPLAEREPRMVLGWVIFRDGLTRAYPWRDFGHMPRDKDYTTWPFYYLADPAHNPGGGEVFTDPYLDPLSGEWMISCLSPVYVQGQHWATAGIDITIEKLLREIGEIRLSEGTSSFLLSDTGIIAASENLPLAALGLNPSAPPHGQNPAESSVSQVAELADRMIGQVENVELVDTGTQRLFAGYAGVSPPGWRMVFLVPEDDVVGPAYESAATVVAEAERVRRNFIHVVIFSLLGILGLAWVVLAHQSRGLRLLVGAIRRFGEGDLSYRVEVTPGELGELAGALNSMAGGLQDKKRELQRVYAEVEQSRKLAAVGRLAAGVAHDVNNPLATISTYAQMLMRRPDLSEEARQDLDVVMAEISRIQEKLRNLLDLSRLQSPVKGPLDLDRLVQEVAALARHEAEARGTALRLALNAEGETIHADRSGVKQVLWNLLGNAMDAQGPGGEVWVRTAVERRNGGPPSFLLEVEDCGPGIPDHVLPKIFEPFFTTKEVGQGTGLGLAVAYRIVQGHGGRIDVENLMPRGCLFRVVLPQGGDA